MDNGERKPSALRHVIIRMGTAGRCYLFGKFIVAPNVPIEPYGTEMDFLKHQIDARAFVQNGSEGSKRINGVAHPRSCDLNLVK
ncbi:unnamed protein product [Acanthoscelides obtectus]|uniref:Uncharacterized protein n=1 Tax=Acanthoscelides obtectus TaxID=200917 RepID=A0A9P0Q1Q3_ACAOB|nr:unnamed protein product [Acanthoscelides obtectus]CAK1670961.1 hypothetical protein AOBTE_LOCUS27949 [Acanthoscelides obtectus]